MSCPRTLGLATLQQNEKLKTKKILGSAKLTSPKKEIKREALSELMIIRAFDYNYKKIADLDLSYIEAVKVETLETNERKKTLKQTKIKIKGD